MNNAFWYGTALGGLSAGAAVMAGVDGWLVVLVVLLVCALAPLIWDAYR